MSLATSLAAMEAFFAPMISTYGDVWGSLNGLDRSLLIEDFPNGLWKAFTLLNPLAVVCLMVTFLFLYAFLGSILTDDYSFVDRQWSIVPALYSLNFALHPSSAFGPARQDRLLIMSALSVVWAMRLTFNFWRRGGYSGMEDYRWTEIRKRVPHPVLWQIFNLTFIAGFQPILLMLLTLPAWLCRESNAPLNNLDYVATGAFLFFVIMETTADQQQWNFQNAKYAARRQRKTLSGDYARGFLTGGLFRYSRHPNFFAEQCVWLSYYLFSVAATGQWLNYSCIGVALLILLFQTSTSFTEMLTEKRYPLYKEYQKITSRLIPFLPLGRMPEKKD